MASYETAVLDNNCYSHTRANTYNVRMSKDIQKSVYIRPNSLSKIITCSQSAQLLTIPNLGTGYGRPATLLAH